MVVIGHVDQWVIVWYCGAIFNDCLVFVAYKFVDFFGNFIQY